MTLYHKCLVLVGPDESMGSLGTGVTVVNCHKDVGNGACILCENKCS